MAEIEDVIFGISPLVKCECLVGPAKSSNLALRQAYLDLFEDFATLAMPEEVFLSAAELRATERLNTPDALHLACARHHRCDALWTNDNRFARRARGFVRNILAGR
ncbi:MAG TPA: type II toxin-antitoxin system VapC family toxin [Stellaceae bacterium]|jgi:predicted nucleic acid-binding protein|nr:type II toxin-antitoxin system VapC family toxin [Stellaceae bacterium]